ncbi:M23 family metallopeptidase [Vibrio sp. S9_S30]|uniref:M23 family metallopeptidase n=1 Tax=Vibrio sp. S9_S30 TaxID=2720226 RepID=UPI00168153D0|nr:M23 family metallopeptidase [Vibrio sp. S9_S30]MBD1557790.1 M23 family metallopeptidase [Vibrio sp. S9_S30]
MKKIVKKTSQAAILFVAFVFETQAQIHPEEAFAVTPFQVKKLDISSPQLINDRVFLYGPELYEMDWDDFFAQNAPLLAEKKEVIMHWAGYASISPKLILSLIEMQSGLVSEPDEEKLENPLPGLTNKIGFDAQVKAVTLRLSQRFYAFEEALNREKSALPQYSTPAILALQSTLSEIRSSEQEREHTSNSNAQLNELLDAYEQVFAGESLVRSLQPKSDELTLSAKSSVDNSAENSANNSADNSADDTFTLHFPWPSGSVWRSSGAHSFSGFEYPYSSLDFSNSKGGWGSDTPWVQASHGGTVTRHSRCNITVTHSSGYATNYYHMDNLQYNTGDNIAAGAWLGRYANNISTALCEGGHSSAPHLHWSLLRNGRYISLQDMYISGYRVNVGNRNYDSNCRNFYFEKDGHRTCAFNRLYR